MVLFTVVAFAVEISPYAIHDCSDYLADYHVRYEDWGANWKYCYRIVEVYYQRCTQCGTLTGEGNLYRQYQYREHDIGYIGGGTMCMYLDCEMILSK